MRERDGIAGFVDGGAGGAEFYTVIPDIDELEMVREAFNTADSDWPILIDRDATVSAAFGVTKVPETWIIDPDGIVVYRTVGAVSADELESVLTSLASSPVGSTPPTSPAISPNSTSEPSLGPADSSIVDGLVYPTKVVGGVADEVLFGPVSGYGPKARVTSPNGAVYLVGVYDRLGSQLDDNNMMKSINGRLYTAREVEPDRVIYTSKDVCSTISVQHSHPDAVPFDAESTELLKALTVTGRTLGDEIERAGPGFDQNVVRSVRVVTRSS